jgi:hypothetical protein
MVLRTVLGDVIDSLDFTWLLSLPMWGVDVDGLAYSLHRPMVCSHQMREQSFLSSVALFNHAVVGDDAFSGGVKPSGLDI